MAQIQNASDPLVTNDEDSPLLGSRLGRGFDDSESTNTSSIHVNIQDVDEFNKSRWRSVRVMYLTVFLGAITFTITMSSLWPFLQVLDPESKSSFLGWVVASYSLGQLIASPVFGAWSNWRKSSKEPLTVSLILMILSNFFYTYLQSLPCHKQLFMILARGLIGFSAGNVAVVRSYIAGATTIQERTSAMANLSMWQAMGFILGPVLQSILVLVKYPGPVEVPEFHLNMYTAPAFLAASVALINLILFLMVFKEYRLNDDDVLREVNGNTQHSTEANGDKSLDAFCHSNSHQGVKEYKLDLLAVWSSIYLFFVVLFMFTVFETIGTPLTMHMYAWSKSRATFYQGIILGVGGVFSVCVFGATKYLAQKYNERYLLLIGFLFCLAGYFAFIPWGHHLPPRGLAPIKNNSHPTPSEAIFSVFNDLFHEHKFGFIDTQATKIQPAVGPNSPTPLPLPASMENKTFAWVKSSNKHDTNYQNKPLTKSDVISMDMEQNMNQNYFQNKQKSRWTDAIDAKFTRKNHTTMTTEVTTHNKSMSTTSSPTNSSYIPEGCPWQYHWCAYVPVIPLLQYLFASLLVTIGYPMCNMLTYTIYSKVLGPKPQGLWMGWLTASGSFARTVGPIYVSQIYDLFGPQVTYGSISSYIFLTILFYLLVFRRLVPFTYSLNPRAPLLFWKNRSNSRDLL